MFTGYILGRRPEGTWAIEDVMRGSTVPAKASRQRQQEISISGHTNVCGGPV